jgi:hypothetical protein
MAILDVLTALGEGPHIWKEIGTGQNSVGVMVGPRTHPRCVIPGFKGFNLGLFDQGWARRACRKGAGAATYYVRVEPIYDKMVDVAGNALKGPPNAESVKGTTFTFDPMPAEYPCTGYNVYAGTVSGQLYLQGELAGRDTNSFEIGVTWAYNGGPAGLLDALIGGPPQFASLAEVYQEEGAVESRLFIGGGKLYNAGYAQVDGSASPPSLVCGTDTPASIVGSLFDALTDGSFRMRIDGVWWDFVALNTSASTSPDGVAQVIQTAIRATQNGYLAGGPISAADQATLLAQLAAIADGKFDVTMGGVLVPIGSIDFANYDGVDDPIDSLTEAAAAVETALQRAGCPLDVHWDSTRGAFFIEQASGYSVPELVLNGSFGDTSAWDIEGTDWTINTGTNQADFSSGVGNAVRNGNFATAAFWDFTAPDWSHDGVGLEADFNSASLNKIVDPHCQNIGSWNLPLGGSSLWAITGGTKLTYSGATNSNDWAHVSAPGIVGVGVQVLLNVTACTGSFQVRVGTNGSAAGGTLALEVSEPGFYAINVVASAAGSYVAIRPYVGGTYIEIDEIACSIGSDSTTQKLFQDVGPLQEFDAWDLSIVHAGLVSGDHLRIVLEGTGGVIYGELHDHTAASPITETFNVPAGYDITQLSIQNYSIGNASPNYSVDTVSLTMSTPADNTAIVQNIGYLGGKTVTVGFTLYNLDGTEGLRVRVVDAEGNIGIDSGVKQRAGGDADPLASKAFSFDLIVPNDGKHYDRIEFRNETVGGGSTYELDLITVKIKAAMTFPLSYMSDPGSAIGTPIGLLLRATTESEGSYAQNQVKAATTEEVQWVDGRYVIKGATAGEEYEISFLETALYNIGTDISGAGYLDGREDEGRAVYKNGFSAGTMVTGDGVEWGKWCEGMLFRGENDDLGILVSQYIDSTHLLLDSAYTGEALVGLRKYILKPFNAQLYASELGNPFAFKTDNIYQLPTSDSDGMTFLRRLGTNIAIGMQHHLWLIDGVNLGAPKMLSDIHGAPNPKCVISFGAGLAILTGEDFVAITEGRAQSMDPDNRIKDLLARMEDGGAGAHGKLVWTPGGPVLKWWVKLDGSDECNKVIVYEPRRGNFWPENCYPDARCSTTIRDTNDKPILYTASTTDPFYKRINDADLIYRSRLFRHGRTYKNDGAPSGITVQGIISSVQLGGGSYGYTESTGTSQDQISVWNTLDNASFGITFNGKVYECGPVDFSASADMDAVAQAIEDAINATDLPTDAGADVSFVWHVDAHFQMSFSGGYIFKTLGPFAPYYADINSVDISVSDWINGRVLTSEAVSARFTGLVLTKFDGTTPVDPATQADVRGLYIYVCDSQFRNGQFHRVVGWNTTFHRAHIPPEASVSIAAGWYWYLAGLVPRWKKWWDWGSPQHKQKVYSLAFTADPTQGASGNTLAVHGYQDLIDTIRTTQTVALGGTNDTVHRVDIMDKPSTQQALEIIRPSSEYDLQIEDMVVTHRPNV